MKKLLLLLLILINKDAFSQNEMLFATVNHDTVTILDSNAYRNCAMFNTWDIYVAGNQINLFERDTFMNCALCDCLFDFSVTFSNLAPGTYNATVYYFYMAPFCPPDTNLVGSVSFTINSKNEKDAVQIISEYTNPCHSPNGVHEINSVTSFEVFPNPTTSVIHFTLPGNAGGTESFVFNSLGEIVLKVKVPKAKSEVKIDVAALPAGLYFVKANGYAGKFIKQ